MYLRLLPLSLSLAELTSVLFRTTRQGAGVATRLGAPEEGCGFLSEHGGAQRTERREMGVVRGPGWPWREMVKERRCANLVGWNVLAEERKEQDEVERPAGGGAKALARAQARKMFYFVL